MACAQEGRVVIDHIRVPVQLDSPHRWPLLLQCPGLLATWSPVLSVVSTKADETAATPGTTSPS